MAEKISEFLAAAKVFFHLKDYEVEKDRKAGCDRIYVYMQSKKQRE